MIMTTPPVLMIPSNLVSTSEKRAFNKFKLFALGDLEQETQENTSVACKSQNNMDSN